jgi:plastocyanin
VPEGATKAIVFTADAVNATFSYAGYRAPVVELGIDSLDLTVPAGATVQWLNKTADYSYVRHTPAAGKTLFDSSPKAGTGLRVGDTFSHTFTEVGTFPYATSTGTGTITVIEGPGVGAPAPT